MRWTWELTKRAEKDLARIDRPIRARIFDALDRLAEELTVGATLSNVKKLVGGDHEEWRLRVGDYRAIFQMEVRIIVPQEEGEASESGAVIVVKVAHRREVYKG
jgi:mRNA-degrading endonuclease RelE of RelBE toxin-antitoxin system